MDLHSSESYDTCKQILSIGHKLGYDFCILPETIIETKNLLHRKSESITEIPVFAAQDRQSIEFGCYRKGITGNELLEYEKFCESFVRKNEIRVIDISINDRLKKNVFQSEIYRKISNRPRNKMGAIHDAMAMEFVKENRTNEEERFSDTASFFVTDSHGYIEKKINLSTRLPLVIRAEELITLLWLVFPYHDTDLIKSEISKIFSMYLNKRLPDKELLLSIDRKNRSFKNIGIHAKDCIKLAFDVSEIDSSQIENLLSIKEEDDYFKELGRLAHIASENKEKHESKLQKYTEVAIDLTWEENNKKMIQENESLKRTTLEKTKENDRLRILKDNNEIKILIDTQKDIVYQMGERIKELSAPIDLVATSLKVIFIIISIVSIIIAGVKFIIPNWDNISPHIFIGQLIFPLLIILSEIFGLTRKLNYVGLSKVITNLLFKKRTGKIITLKKELEEKNKYLSDLRERQNNIIY
jgi:ribosomal protein S8